MNNPRLGRFITPINLWLSFISIAFAVNSYLYLYLKINRANLLKPIGIGSMGFIYFFLIILVLLTLVYILNYPRGMVIKFILVFLPMEIVLIYGYLWHSIGYDKTVFNYTLRPFVSLYLIFTCFYFLFKYKKYEKIRDFFLDFRDCKVSKEKNDHRALFHPSRIPIVGNIIFWFRKQGLWATLIILTVLVLNLGFGSYHLAEFAGVDEPLWTHDRIPKFWSNVADGEFNKTMVSDKPGITVALISGVSLNWINPMYYKNSHWEGEELENYLDTQDLNFSLRFPILLFNALMLLVFYSFVKKLSGRSVALISFIWIGLSPLLIGISTIINPDSLLWTFTPLSLLAYLIYLKDRQNKYLYWTGIFLGLAILTKYVANILFVFFFGLIFLEYIINHDKYKDSGAGKYFKSAFADYFIIIFLSLATFFLFLPAAWVHIGRIFEGTILSKAFISIWPAFLGIISLIMLDIWAFKNKITAAVTDNLSKYRSAFILFFNLIFVVLIIMTVINTYWGMKFSDLETILASPKSSKTFGGNLGMMMANFYSLIFGLAPLAFLGLLYSGIHNIFRKEKINDTVVSFTYIALFILFYYFASTVEGVSATTRYQIILYPLALILSGIGICQFANNEKVKKYLVPGSVYLIIIITAVYSLNSIKPFYFSYASDMLPKKYVLNPKDMGDGSYEASAWLNKLPNAKNMIIWTDKRGVCAFFLGICRSGFDFDLSEKIDYFVVSSGRESRTGKMTAGRIVEGDKLSEAVNKIYSQDTYDYKLEIGGRPNNFVKIVSGERILKN
jgi:hypothetical protein